VSQALASDTPLSDLVHDSRRPVWGKLRDTMLTETSNVSEMGIVSSPDRSQGHRLVSIRHFLPTYTIYIHMRPVLPLYKT